MERSDAAGLPQGLMAFWAGIEPANQCAYARWHNAEHMPERLGIPGFRRGARYRSVRDDDRFLMYYETESPAVLTSAAYLAALNQPTARTRAALGWFRDPVRNVYGLLSARGRGGPSPAPVVAWVRCTGTATELPDPQTRAFAPFSVRRIAHYELEPAGSAVRTSESALHGATSTSTGGLLRLECDDLRLLDDADAQAGLEQALAQWCETAGLGGLGPTEVASIEFWLESQPQEARS
jgi:hypothetical protein